MIMKSEFDFMDSPLCVWTRSVLSENQLDYEKFSSGEYFYQLLKRSDPRLQNSNSNLPNEITPQPNNQQQQSDHYDTTYRSRLLNLDFILRNIRSFYQDVLNQILLIKLPDIYQIAKHPDSEETFKEMEKMLLLILGLAINGEFKTKFIEQIQQQFETNTQMQLVPFIQLVTDDLNFSINRTFISKFENCADDNFSHFINAKLMPNIQRVIDERDSYLESIIELEQDKDYLLFKLNNNYSISEKDTLLQQQQHQQNQQANLNNQNNSDLKHVSINELILNLVNNSNTICKLESSSSPQESLINETQLISKLIDSIINKENDINLNNSNDDNSSNNSSQNTSATNLMTRNSMSTVNHISILNDLKNRKSLTNNWNQKIAIELVECKIRLKQLINEIEEKCEQIESLKDEIDDFRKQFTKLRGENMELQQKAALADVYSDEMESLREKSTKVEKFESEITKLKDKIEELQIDKTRLEELREENLILIETRTLMEKQINDYQVRLLGIQRLDADLNKYKQEIDGLNKQADIDNKRMCSLCEKNAKLEIEIKNLLNQNTSLDEELSYYKQKFTFTSAELNKQQANLTHLQQTVQTQSTQLNIKQSEYQIQINDLNEQINQRDIELTSLRDNLRFKETSLNENQTKIRVLTEQLNLEHENKIKCERCLEQHKIEIKELQLRLDDCVNETKKLDKSIRAAAESNEMKENETEENFKTLIDSNKKLNESYTKLSKDHDELQKIYLQLEIDYDEIYQELNKKHSSLNQLNNEIDQLKDKYTASLIMIDDLSNKLSLIESIKKNDTACNTIESLQDLNSYENKFKTLNSEINHLKIKKEENEIEIKKLMNDNTILKSENKNVIEFNKKNEKIQQEHQLNINQLNEKIQQLEHLNEKLEDERSQLFEQLHLLLQQNQEMLTQSLQNKDVYHEETKAYIQQLNCLKRQKEILEQKIMEQYKNCPSLSQKKSKKILSCGGNNSNCNSNGNLIDMFSKTTRSLVQKVRNKSSTTNINSNTGIQTEIHENDNTDHGFYSEHPHKIVNKSFLCHQYSADDINNYLSVQPNKETIDNLKQITPNTRNVTISSLSSSSTSSSSSSSSIPQISYETSSNIKQPITPTKQQITSIITPIKYDPKSLKLGGRPQSICSMTSVTSSSFSSPPPCSSLSSQTNKQPHLSDFKRVVITSSPNNGSSTSTNPYLISSSATSPSSTSSSSSSSSSVKLQSTPPPSSTSSSTSSISNNYLNKNNSPILLSSLSARQHLQTTPNSKIAAKIADSLNKFRQAANDEITLTSADNINNCDDDIENNQQIKNKNAKKSNEIWLEYGCI